MEKAFAASRQYFKRLPPVRWALTSLNKYRLRAMRVEERFFWIYAGNRWGGGVSRSGLGSDLAQTVEIRSQLPKLIQDFRVKTLLDVPCGDCYWIFHVDLRHLDKYIGADIVKDMIVRNKEKYATDFDLTREFLTLDICNDEIPKADMVLCRDCLVHFSFEHVWQALGRFGRSSAEYLLMTHFTGKRDNVDIVTGEWRPLNFERPPFLLPRPIRVIDERCTLEHGRFADKSLGLWRIEDLSSALARRGLDGRCQTVAAPGPAA